MSDSMTVTALRGPISNDVSIILGGVTISGWQNVRLTRSIEHFPSTFQIELTERYPTQVNVIVLTPGDPIKVKFGGTSVLTGYLDDYEVSIAEGKHSVRISGRSACMDMIDCSAGESPYQLVNTTLVKLAQQMVTPYGINVIFPDGDSAQIPAFSVTLGETAYEILEPIARWANFIIYDDVDGNLVISKVGKMKAASGFSTGKNIQSLAVNYSVQNRYTEIEAYFLSVGFLNDNSVPELGSSNPVVPSLPKAIAKDSSFPKRADGMPRFRRLIIQSEQTQIAPALAQNRVNWEMSRRIGRSQAVRLVVDSWRDSAGKLWEVNTLAALNIPEAKLSNATWLIATITFVRDDNGTTAELVLMPPSAFVPEPQNIVPFDANLARELPGGAGNLGPAAR